MKKLILNLATVAAIMLASPAMAFESMHDRDRIINDEVFTNSKQSVTVSPQTHCLACLDDTRQPRAESAPANNSHLRDPILLERS